MKLLNCCSSWVVQCSRVQEICIIVWKCRHVDDFCSNVIPTTFDTFLVGKCNTCFFFKAFFSSIHILLQFYAVNVSGKQREFGGIDHGDDQAALLNPANKALTQIVQDDSFREFDFRQYLFACQSKVCKTGNFLFNLKLVRFSYLWFYCSF